MALRDQPYLPLYVQDYLTDEKLNLCTASTQGIYIKIMCLFHKSETYGGILLKQKDKQNESNTLNLALKFAKLLTFNLPEIESAIIELLEEGVLFLDGDFLCQKRMVKDNELSVKRSEIGSKGGIKTQTKNKDFAKAKVKANTEYENEIENEDELVIDPKKEKAKKLKFSEFVSLTESEHESLLKEHGEKDTLEMILTLNNYKGANGKKYKSDYLAILNWVVDKVKQNKKTTNGTNFRTDSTLYSIASKIKPIVV